MWAAFERECETIAFEADLCSHGFGDLAWAEFVLNPRRLRGSDFLMRWSQGVWSEHRVREAIDATGEFVALPYGPSGVAPSGDPRAYELYFERLETAGLGGIKRPDLLVIPKGRAERAAGLVSNLGGSDELPFLPDGDLRALLDLAVAAVECENSLWKAAKMPAFGRELKLQSRSGRLGMPKSAVLPTVIIKDEDLGPLLAWQDSAKIAVHVWQIFFDRAYGIALSEAKRLVAIGLIDPTRQVFQAPGGSTTAKVIYKIYYQYGYRVGESSSEPTLVPEFIEDRNGHILPYVRFEGGSLQLADEALAVLRRSAG